MAADNIWGLLQTISCFAVTYLVIYLPTNVFENYVNLLLCLFCYSEYFVGIISLEHRAYSNLNLYSWAMITNHPLFLLCWKLSCFLLLLFGRFIFFILTGITTPNPFIECTDYVQRPKAILPESNSTSACRIWLILANYWDICVSFSHQIIN